VARPARSYTQYDQQTFRTSCINRVGWVGAACSMSACGRTPAHDPRRQIGRPRWPCRRKPAAAPRRAPLAPSTINLCARWTETIDLSLGDDARETGINRMAGSEGKSDTLRPAGDRRGVSAKRRLYVCIARRAVRARVLARRMHTASDFSHPAACRSTDPGWVRFPLVKSRIDPRIRRNFNISLTL
jgi:hypothetical protein